jgi:hypothetical protein
MNIDQLNYNPGESIYYDADFHTFILSYYMYFMDPINNLLTTTVIEPGIALKYTGDFIGLLNYTGIDPEYHWFVMFINGLRSPTQMNKNLLSLLVPSTSELEILKNLYTSTG